MRHRDIKYSKYQLNNFNRKMNIYNNISSYIHSYKHIYIYKYIYMLSVISNLRTFI